MKKNLIPLVGIALVVALASTGIFYGLVAGKLSSRAPKPAATVVVAARSLPGGHLLTAADVKAVGWGGETKPEGALHAVEEAAGHVLLQPLAGGEAVTSTRLVSATGTGNLGIPAGMRAVSVTASDSSGVLALVQPGHRVDVVVVVRNERDMAARTIVQNIEVLDSRKADSSGRGSSAPVVTLLASPEQADLLALADSVGRVRLLLRNPVDKDHSPRGRILQTALLDGRHAPAAAVREARAAAGAQSAAGVQRASGATAKATNAAAAGRPASRLVLSVRVLGAAAAALAELGRGLPVPPAASSLQVSAYAPETDVEGLLSRLESGEALRVLSRARLVAANHGAVSFEAGGGAEDPLDGCGIRVQFTPAPHAGSGFRLRVEPEVSAPAGEGIATHRIRTELELRDGQSFLVSGFAGQGSEAMLERLFRPAPPAAGREVLVLVTARNAEHWQAAGLRPAR